MNEPIGVHHHVATAENVIAGEPVGGGLPVEGAVLSALVHFVEAGGASRDVSAFKMRR